MSQVDSSESADATSSHGDVECDDFPHTLRKQQLPPRQCRCNDSLSDNADATSLYKRQHEFNWKAARIQHWKAVMLACPWCMENVSVSTKARHWHTRTGRKHVTAVMLVCP